MVNNYYTLRYIASDLHQQLSGCSIDSLFSQDKHELVIAIGGLHLLLSCEPALNHIYMRSTFARARRNTIDLFPHVVGKKIVSVSISPSDREIAFNLESGNRLLIQLYGGKGNAYLVDQDRNVLDAFLKPREQVGSTLAAAPIVETSPPASESLHATIHSIGHIAAFAALKKAYPLFGFLLVRELCHRAGIEEHRTGAEISATATKALFDAGRNLIRELTEAVLARIYYEDQHAVAFAITELRHMEPLQSKTFESIHAAVRIFLGSSRRDKGFSKSKEHIMQKLRTERDRLERTMHKISQDADALERAAGYELYGRLLKTHLHSVLKGASSVDLENVFSPTREITTISLDPHLSAARNADRYFEKARKARHSLDEQSKRRKDVDERYDRVTRLLEALGSLQSLDQWKQSIVVYREELERAGIRMKSDLPRTEPPIPFRVFVVDGGFQVWAGKSNENNDLLTLKYAKPNDLWFHVRGASGSHVVLRVETGKGEPSKRAILQAASIAAYFSKMKNATLAPVAMTEKKYVRKPKGVPAGTVRLEREKTVMAEPRLPDKNGINAR